MTAAALGLTLLLVGCPGGEKSDAEPSSSTDSVPTLRILVLDDEQLADAIERQWAASERGDLTLTVASLSSIENTKRLPADCVIYPTSSLGELAERRLIRPLPEATVASETLNREDIFPLVRRHETTWGTQVYAVPFGSPQLVLLYRTDVLKRLGRSAPATWSEYDELVRLLRKTDGIDDLSNIDRDRWRPGVEPLADGWAGKTLLARAAAYARDRQDVSALFDYETMTPRIDGPPFVRALSELTAAAEDAPTAALATTPELARESLLAGRCALAITWPVKHVDAKADANVPLAVAPLPGAAEVYHRQKRSWDERDEPSRVPLLGISGRLGSVTSSARHTRAAADALVWLSGADKGSLVAAQSDACSLCRSSQVREGQSWVSPAFGRETGKQYADILQEDKSKSLWIISPRIAGRGAYMAALDAAVHAALHGKKSPEKSLSDAARAWREITQRIGKENQTAAYARSLGLAR